MSLVSIVLVTVSIATRMALLFTLLMPVAAELFTDQSAIFYLLVWGLPLIALQVWLSHLSPHHRTDCCRAPVKCRRLLRHPNWASPSPVLAVVDVWVGVELLLPSGSVAGDDRVCI